MNWLSNWASGHLVCHSALNVLNYLDWYKLTFTKQSKMCSDLVLKAGRLPCSPSFYMFSPILNGKHNAIFPFSGVVSYCCWINLMPTLQQWRLSLSHSNSLATSNSVLFLCVCFSFTLLFLWVLTEPSCNYIFCVISLASPLVSWKLIEAKRRLAQNALHLVTDSNNYTHKRILVPV